MARTPVTAAKGAVKLHLTLDHDGYLPRLAVISEANKPEVTVACDWTFPRGMTLLFDKAFIDYGWFDELTEGGVQFVTCFRKDGQYETLSEREPPENSRVRSDRIIRLGVGPHRMKNRLRSIEFERSKAIIPTNRLQPSTSSKPPNAGAAPRRWGHACAASICQVPRPQL